MNKKKILMTGISAMAVIFTSLVGNLASHQAHADQVDLHQILNGGQRCDHVISLLHRHGVNNSRDLSGSPDLIHPLGAFAIPAADLGDLQLVQVTQAAEIGAGCGPTFHVTIQNTSNRDVCGFRVTLVGLFGRITPHSPNCTLQVDKVCAGAAVEISMTLPLEALAMGNHNGQILGFQRLLVVVDSFDQFMECDEANNLRVFDRSAIPVVAAAEVTADVGPAVGSTAETIAAPAAGDVPVSTTSTQAIPESPEANSGGADANAPAAIAPATTPANPPAAVGDDLKSALDQFTQQSVASDEVVAN